MSLRLTALQQQVQKEIEGLERETRNMREQLVTKDEEAETLRRALRALGGVSKDREPAPERGRATGDGGGDWKRNQWERAAMREGVLKYLKEQPGLTSEQLAKLIGGDMPESEISPFRITRIIGFLSEVIGHSDSGWTYVPAEGEEDAGMGTQSE